MLERLSFFFILVFTVLISFSQAQNPVSDAEATSLLQKVSERYRLYKNISADFRLLIQRPKIKANEDDKKLSDTLSGKILLQGAKFNISIKDQQIICDGKNIWTYIPTDKEVQVNYFEESNEIFSPSKIFTLYKEGYLYQIKEKKTVNGKSVTVIEMAPPNRKLSYFKIEVSIDDAALQILESKIYQKNGVHYIYKLIRQSSGVATTDESFTFEAKKFPGVKVVDLR